MFFSVYLGCPLPGGSGLPLPSENLKVWLGFGPDPGGICFLYFFVDLNVVALWEASYRGEFFDQDTLRVPTRSPTPTSKTNDFRGPLDDIWGARGPHVRPIFGGSGRLGRR